MKLTRQTLQKKTFKKNWKNEKEYAYAEGSRKRSGWQPRRPLTARRGAHLAYAEGNPYSEGPWASVEAHLCRGGYAEGSRRRILRRGQTGLGRRFRAVGIQFYSCSGLAWFSCGLSLVLWQRRTSSSRRHSKVMFLLVCVNYFVCLTCFNHWYAEQSIQISLAEVMYI